MNPDCISDAYTVKLRWQYTIDTTFFYVFMDMLKVEYTWHNPEKPAIGLDLKIIIISIVILGILALISGIFIKKKGIFDYITFSKSFCFLNKS